MVRVNYQSPRNTVFYLMERGGLFTLDDVAHTLHMSHGNAERALDANVRLGRLKKDGDFYTATKPIPHSLRTWELLGERLLTRTTDPDRRRRYAVIWEEFIQPECYEGGA